MNGGLHCCAAYPTAHEKSSTKASSILKTVSSYGFFSLARSHTPAKVRRSPECSWPHRRDITARVFALPYCKSEIFKLREISRKRFNVLPAVFVFPQQRRRLAYRSDKRAVHALQPAFHQRAHGPCTHIQFDGHFTAPHARRERKDAAGQRTLAAFAGTVADKKVLSWKILRGCQARPVGAGRIKRFLARKQHHAAVSVLIRTAARRAACSAAVALHGRELFQCAARGKNPFACSHCSFMPPDV